MNLLFANDRQGTYPASWYAATANPLPALEPLKGKITCDVCVVGGGYTGLSAALHLAELGYSVALLEAHRVGFGASGRNGGQVGSGQRLGQRQLEKMLGPDDAAKMWDIAEDAKKLVRDLIAEHGIDAAYKPGIAHTVWNASELEAETKDAAHLAKQYDYKNIQILDRDGVTDLTGSDRFVGGTLDMGAGHLHPLRYAIGLAKAAIAAGVQIYENSHVHHIKDGPTKTIQTAKGRVLAEHLVLATNGYSGGLNRKLAARVMPINNFIVATEPLDTRNPEILPQDVAALDSKFVVNYWRLSEDKRLLFGGGESYGYRFPSDIAAKVRKPLTKIYPQLRDVKIDYAWGGTLAVTAKRMPYFSKQKQGLWTAAGYSGHGVAMATMAGKMIGQAIHGESAQFDVMARVKLPTFPGGALFRHPLLVGAMTWHVLRDQLGI